MLRTPLTSLSLLLAAGALACGPSGDQARVEAAASAPLPEERPQADYVIGLQKAGPREGQLKPEEQLALHDGYYAYVAGLASSGVLLAAGPLVAPRSDPANRMLFLFDVASVEEARGLVDADPGIGMGASVVELYPWRSPSPVGSLLDIEREAEEAHKQDPKNPRPGKRAYVLATADAGKAGPALEVLRREHKAPFYGRMGGDLEGRLLVALDAQTADEAQQLLDQAGKATGTSVAWTMDVWLSTGSVAMLETR
jgi:uncharacterized protein